MSTPARAVDWSAGVEAHRARRAAVTAARQALGLPASGQLDLDQLVVELAALKTEVAELRRPVGKRVKAALRRAVGARHA